MSDRQVLVLGGGCFWCTESVYVGVKGVTDVESGYSNGHVKQPSYEAGVHRHAPATTRWCGWSTTRRRSARARSWRSFS